MQKDDKRGTGPVRHGWENLSTSLYLRISEFEVCNVYNIYVTIINIFLIPLFKSALEK